jgi:hypothetical protein
MKLLIYSHFFAPSVGGVETIVLSLAPRARRTSRFKRCPAIRNHPGHADFGGQLSGQRASLSRGSPPRFPAAMTTHSKRRRAPRRRARANSALSRLVFAQTAGHRTSRLPGPCPNGLLFHHPSGSVCRGHFLAGNYRECLKCNAKTEGAILAQNHPLLASRVALAPLL